MTNFFTNKFPGNGGSLTSTILAITSGGNAGLMGILFPIAVLALTQLALLGTIFFQRLSDVS